MDQILADPDAIAPGGRLDIEQVVFGFEVDFAADLRCIPMLVRFKLDRVGVKLSLKQWTRIGAANRHRLVALSCDTQREVAAYRSTLIRLVTQHSSEQIVELKADTAPCWADTRMVAQPVVRQAASNSVASPTPEQWASLSALQRFALVKLARSNHDNDNFVPAMREFGLLGSLQT
jgi:hypothetical protein